MDDGQWGYGEKMGMHDGQWGCASLMVETDHLQGVWESTLFSVHVV